MMGGIKKDALTDKIWVDGEWWDLVDVRRPTTEETYLILQTLGSCCHEDGSPVVYMCLVDCDNDVWYTDTTENRALLTRRECLQEWLDEIDQGLAKNWIDDVYEEEL